MDHRGIPLAAAVAFAALPALSAGVPEWPGWRGAGRDGVSVETGLAAQWPAGGPPLAWKASGVAIRLPRK